MMFMLFLVACVFALWVAFKVIGFVTSIFLKLLVLGILAVTFVAVGCHYVFRVI